MALHSSIYKVWGLCGKHLEQTYQKNCFLPDRLPGLETFWQHVSLWASLDIVFGLWHGGWDTGLWVQSVSHDGFFDLLVAYKKLGHAVLEDLFHCFWSKVQLRGAEKCLPLIFCWKLAAQRRNNFFRSVYPYFFLRPNGQDLKIGSWNFFMKIFSAFRETNF